MQYNQVMEANDQNTVTYERGILLQNIPQEQALYTVPLDGSLCHGSGIVGSSHISQEISSLKPSEQAEEMEYKKCYSSVLPNNSTNTDQVKMFGHDKAADLDVTCSQQEVFFRDYSNTQLVSPAGLQEIGKMDSKSFLLSQGSNRACIQGNKVTHNKEIPASTSTSNMYGKRQPFGEITYEQRGCDSQNGAQHVLGSDENVELTACHSFTVLESNAQKAKRRSIYEPADLDVTSCYGPGLMKSEVSVQKRQPNLNVSRNSFEADLHAKSLPECETQLDITNCYGNGILPVKKMLGSVDDQTSLQEEHDVITAKNSDNDVSFNSTMFLRSLGVKKSSTASTDEDRSNFIRDENGILPGKTTPVSVDDQITLQEGHDVVTAKNSDNDFSFDSAMFLRSLGVKKSSTASTDADRNNFKRDHDENQLPENTGHLDIIHCYGKGILPSKRFSVAETNHTVVFSANTDNTDSLDLTVCQTQQQQQQQATAPPFSTLPSQTRQNAHELPSYSSSKMDPSFFLTSLGANIRQSGETNDEECDLELTTCHSQTILDNSAQKTSLQSVVEPADLDVTSCHGPGLLQTQENDDTLGKSTWKENRKTLYEPDDVDVTTCHGSGLLKSSGKNLEVTVSSNQLVVDTSSHKANRRSLYEPADIDVTSCYGVGLLKSTGENLDAMALRNQPVLDNSPPTVNKTCLNEPADIDVTSCYGAGLLKSTGENLDAMAPRNQPVVDKSSQKTNRRSLYEPADIDVTSCYGAGLLKSTGEDLDAMAPHNQPIVDNNPHTANRRSLLEPVDIRVDVTSCYGTGLLKSTGENLDAMAPYNQLVDKSSQKTNRRSLYEAADIDVTSCYGQGMVETSSKIFDAVDPHNQPVTSNSSHKANRRSLYEPADIDVTSCYGSGMVKTYGENLHVEQTVYESQPVQNNSSHNTNRRSLYEPADIDVTSCYGSGMVKTSEENLEVTVFQHQPVLVNSAQKNNRRSLYEPVDIDITACRGSNMAKTSGDTLESTVQHNQSTVNSSTHTANRKSLHEPADIATTSCDGPGTKQSSGENLEKTVSHSQPLLDNSTHTANRRSLHEPADIVITSCDGPGIAQSSGENLGKTVCHNQSVFDNSMQKANRRSLYEPIDVDVTSCQGPELIHTLDEQVANLTVSEAPLDLMKGPQTTFPEVEDIAMLDKEDVKGVKASSNACLDTDTDYSLDIGEASSNFSEQIESKSERATSESNDRKLSVICEESICELSKKETSEGANVTEVEEMQNSTQ